MLNMSDNVLTELPDTFHNMTHLTELSVANNQLSTLPPSLMHAEMLETLSVNGNRMSSLPSVIGSLPRLKHLDYEQGCQVISPPNNIMARGRTAILEFLASIFYSQRTLRLDLAGMGLTTIPSEVLTLTNLRRLALDRNLLKSLPPGIGEMCALEELTLSDNAIQELPPEIANLSNLTGECDPGFTLALTYLLVRVHKTADTVILLSTYTYMHTYDIFCVCICIYTYTYNTELDLKGNKISVVPVAVGQLSNLTMLALDTENITSPPKEIIAAGTTVMVDYLRRLFESKVHIYLYVYMYVCVCVYIYIYIYIRTYHGKVWQKRHYIRVFFAHEFLVT